jgi:hypothetical protein
MSNYNFNCNRGICRNTYYNYGSYIRARGNEKQICDVIKGIEDGTIIPNIVSNGGTINGDLTILGNLVITGNISIDIDSINFTGTDITIGSEGSTVTLLGNVKINGTLDVEEETILDNNLTVAENTVLNGTLEIEKETTLKSDLNVTGLVTLNQNLNVSNQIIATDIEADNITANEIECVELQVSHDIIYTDSSESGISIGNGISIPGDDESGLIIYGNCTISNYQYLHPETNNGGNLTVEADLFVNQDVIIDGALTVDGIVTINQMTISNLNVDVITGQTTNIVTINNQLIVDTININNISSTGVEFITINTKCNIEDKLIAEDASFTTIETNQLTAATIITNQIIVNSNFTCEDITVNNQLVSDNISTTSLNANQASITSIMTDTISAINSNSSINISSDLYANQNTITANEFSGDGSNLTGVLVSDDQTVTILNATNYISAPVIYGDTITTNDTDSTINILNDIISNQKITAASFSGDGSDLSNVTIPSDTDLHINSIIATGEVNCVSLTASTSIMTDAISAIDSGSSINISSDIISNQNITAASFSGDGSNLQNITTTIPSDLNINSISATGEVNCDSLTASTSIMTDAISAIDSGSSINISSDIISNQNITAVSFSGDGSNLTNLIPPGTDLHINSISATGQVSCDSLTASALIKVADLEGDDQTVTSIEPTYISTNLFTGDQVEVNQVTAPIITTITEGELRSDNDGYILTSNLKCSTINNVTGTEGIDVVDLITLINGIDVNSLIDLVKLYQDNKLVTINQNQEYVMNATRVEEDIEFSNVSFTLPSE